jgi:hypothetical protein
MDREQFRRIQTRRSFFEQCAGGIGIAALAQLMEQEGRTAAADVNPLAPRKPHFPATAARSISSIPSPACKNGTANPCRRR